MVWAGCGLLCLHLSPEPGLNQKIHIIIPPNASSVTLSLWMHDLWHQYHSKHIISEVIISPNASSVTSWSLQTHICDLIITLHTSSVISLSLWMHDLWHQYHSKRIITDIIIAPNASSVTSLSLQMHHLWHHYLSEYLICDIIAPNTSSVTSLWLWMHHLWHHCHSECIICLRNLQTTPWVPNSRWHSVECELCSALFCSQAERSSDLSQQHTYAPV